MDIKRAFVDSLIPLLSRLSDATIIPRICNLLHPELLHIIIWIVSLSVGSGVLMDSTLTPQYLAEEAREFHRLLLFCCNYRNEKGAPFPGQPLSQIYFFEGEVGSRYSQDGREKLNITYQPGSLPVVFYTSTDLSCDCKEEHNLMAHFQIRRHAVDVLQLAKYCNATALISLDLHNFVYHQNPNPRWNEPTERQLLEQKSKGTVKSWLTSTLKALNPSLFIEINYMLGMVAKYNHSEHPALMHIVEDRTTQDVRKLALEKVSSVTARSVPPATYKYLQLFPLLEKLSNSFTFPSQVVDTYYSAWQQHEKYFMSSWVLPELNIPAICLNTNWMYTAPISGDPYNLQEANYYNLITTFASQIGEISAYCSRRKEKLDSEKTDNEDEERQVFSTFEWGEKIPIDSLLSPRSDIGSDLVGLSHAEVKDEPPFHFADPEWQKQGLQPAHIEKLRMIEAALGNDFNRFYNDPAVQHQDILKRLLDKDVSSKEIKKALEKWQAAGYPADVSPFAELIKNILG